MLTARRLIRAEPTFGIATKLWQISWFYVLLLCLLAGVGYVALYSAAGGSPEPYASAAYHPVRVRAGRDDRCAWRLVDIRFIARLSYVVYGFSVALLILVLRMGHVGKGAQRWIELGGLQLQPSELAKIGLVMALAAWFHKRELGADGEPAVPDSAGDHDPGAGGADPEGAEPGDRR